MNMAATAQAILAENQRAIGKEPNKIIDVKNIKAEDKQALLLILQADKAE